MKGRIPFTAQQLPMPPLDPVEKVSEGILDVVRTGGGRENSCADPLIMIILKKMGPTDSPPLWRFS